MLRVALLAIEGMVGGVVGGRIVVQYDADWPVRLGELDISSELVGRTLPLGDEADPQFVAPLRL